MALQFRRGKEAIAQANDSSRNSGEFVPFLPNFYWKEHEQSRLLWILNPIDDIPLVKLIKPYTKDKRVELVVARQDDAIGASSDPIEDEWGYGPSENNICIAVELKAVMEIRNGRERPVAFEVETREFQRRVRDAKGELTDEKEDVVAPSVGVIAQSPNNFFNHLSTKDSTVGPIHLFPMQIVRSTPGQAKDTDYEIELFEERPLDMSGLLDNWEGISFLSEDEKDEVAALIEKAEDDEEVAIIIGAALLDKWLNTRADEDYYRSVLANIDTPAKYKSKKYQEAQGAAAKEEKSERKTRTSQRRSRREPVESGVDADPVEEIEEPQERVKARRPGRTRAAKTDPEPRTESKDSAEEGEVKATSIRERMEELRAKNAERAKEKDAA